LSDEEELKIVQDLARRYELKFVDVKKSFDHFPLCLARNIGARVASNDILVFVDADVVMDHEFVARTLRKPNGFVTCWMAYLREGHDPISDKAKVRELVPQGQVRRYSYGGGVAAPRKVVEEIRGFDEVYDRAWGADDNDFVDRLIEYGLDWYNLTAQENIVNLHQFHPRTVNEKSPGTIANRKRYDRLQTIVRNENGWGEP
jgi:glycosyltransferase involved in cell wall biosynthesis